MTVDELRAEAKKLGYNIIKVKKPEKLLPCTCGSKRRYRGNRYEKSTGKFYDELVCMKCGKRAEGETEEEAIHNWNIMIQEEGKKK